MHTGPAVEGHGNVVVTTNNYFVCVGCRPGTPPIEGASSDRAQRLLDHFRAASEAGRRRVERIARLVVLEARG